MDLAGFEVAPVPDLHCGKAEKLAALRVDSAFQTAIIRAGLVVDNVGVVGASTGARLEALMGSYAEQIGAFA